MLQLANSLSSPHVEDVYLSRAGDMWLLGTMLYQVMTDAPYWPPHASDAQILEVMADPSKKLPHERNPVHPLVQRILTGEDDSGTSHLGDSNRGLLTRDPARRLTADNLTKHLKDDMHTAQVTLNPGPIAPVDDVELAGL